MLKLMQNPLTPQPSLKMRVWAKVRNNPGLIGSQIAAHFVTEATTSTITSILSTLDVNDVVYSKGAPKQYYTNLDHYVTRASPKSSLMLKPDTAVDNKAPITQPLGIVEEIMENISIAHGRELYKQLHVLFGKGS